MLMAVSKESTSAFGQKFDSVPFDLPGIRKDFPVLRQKPHGQRLTFLDSAASTQKPKQVIDAVRKCYEEEYANVHRGVYWLSQRATERYDAARETLLARRVVVVVVAFVQSL